MKDYIGARILRIKEDSSDEIDDLIAVEKKVRISVNGKHLVSLYCSPSMIREFVVGVVHNEGLISGEWCFERMTIDYGDEIRVDIPSSAAADNGERVVTSGCGGGISSTRLVPSGPIADPSSFLLASIKTVFREFQKKSDAYKMTGGVHSAALTDGRNILAFAEDIGRHNAVDKVTGYCLLEHLDFSGKIMLASGRLSSEIVMKCWRNGIPVLVSRAAPTSLAVRIAAAAGLTVVGFMRGDRMNVYSGKKRIAL